MEKLDKVIAGLECCAEANDTVNICPMKCPYYGERDGDKVCMDFLMADALELLKTYRQRFYERSCGNCGNADYVHEYEIYLCRREDGCHWEPKLEE